MQNASNYAHFSADLSAIAQTVAALTEEAGSLISAQSTKPLTSVQRKRLQELNAKLDAFEAAFADVQCLQTN